MPSWESFHKIAEEVHLWSDLIVNLWMITTAVFYAVIRYTRKASANLSALLDAAVWAMIFVFWVSIATLFVGIFLPHYTLAMWSLIVILFFLMIVGVGLWPEWKELRLPWRRGRGPS